MKNFKKVIALVLAFAMLLSTTTVAFAATDVQNADKATVLNQLGLFAGTSTTEFVPNLAGAANREQAMKIVALALGWKIDTAATTTFKDVSAWAVPYVAYAVKAGITTGVSATEFGAKSPVTARQLSTWVLRALGYPNAWTDLKAAATSAGVIVSDDNVVALNRDALVGVVFAALTATPVGGTETLIASIVKGDTTKAAIAEAAKLIDSKLTVTTKATGAKKIEVTFNKAITTSGVAITVKKGTVAVNTDSVVYAADNKSAVITTTTNLTAGDYTTTVTGAATTALTSVVTVKDVAVAKVNVTSKVAPRLAADNTKAVANYEVLNQYGEKMTGQTLTWTASTGKTVVDNNTTNVLTIEAATGDFVPGAVVYLTGVHAATATVVNAQVEIALASQPDAVVFKGTYDVANSKLAALPAGFADAAYVLLLEVKDQFGNKMSAPDLSKLVFTSNNPLFVTATGGFVAAPTAEVTIDSVVYKAITLKAGSAVDNGGDLTVQAISTLTGKVSTFSTSAAAVSTVKTFTMSAPTAIVAESETVEIPFTAVDQYGAAITKFSALNGKITLAANLAFVQQNDATAKLIYTAPAAGASTGVDLPVYLTSLVTANGNFASQMIYVKETAVPTAIVGIDSDVSTNVAKGNLVEISAANLIVQDQYGRTMTDANVATWINGANSILVTSTLDVATPFTSELVGALGDDATVILVNSAAKVRITAGAATAATETFTFELATANDASTLVAASAKTLTFTKYLKSSYTSYVADDLGLMFNDGGAATTTDVKFNKTVAVYGVLASGTKVALPATDFTVSTAAKVTVTANVISDIAAAGYVAATDFTTAAGDSKNVTSSALITVNDDSGSALAIIEKALVISNVASKVATVTMKSDLVVSGAATMHPAVAVVATGDIVGFIDTQKDQYGVAFVEAPVITVTSLVKVTGSTLAVTGNGTNATAMTGATLGDKFTVTYKYASGVTSVVNFTVGLPQ